TPEPLKMSELPARPWEEVSVDFFGPLPSGEYLMVLIDDYSHFPVVEILTSTSAKAVIPHLDTIFSMFGIPKTCRSDNGPPFNGYEFSQFADYLGFKHRKICPAHPESNSNAENFMKPLQKCVKIAKIEGRSYKQELNVFLRNYRATPHPSTGSAPATLMFSRNIKTGLPEFRAPLDDKPVRDRDTHMKAKAKFYTDSRRNARKSDLSVGDSVLVKQRKLNKLTPAFNPEPATILQKKGSMITVQLGGKTVTRDTSHFKPLTLRSTNGGKPRGSTYVRSDTDVWAEPDGKRQQQTTDYPSRQQLRRSARLKEKWKGNIQCVCFENANVLLEE
ncbi:MAG: transposase family protein, partial [Sedimenticola sp.]